MTTPDEELPKTVRELLAKQAITEALHRYCHGLDRFDRAMASIWHPGGTAEYVGIFEGTGEGFLDWVWPVHEGMQRTSHQVTNILVDVDVEAGTATSHTYVTVALRTADDGVDIVDRGRYLDRWSRRDGVWGIDHRRFEGDIQRVHDVPPPTSQ